MHTRLQSCAELFIALPGQAKFCRVAPDYTEIHTAIRSYTMPHRVTQSQAELENAMRRDTGGRTTFYTGRQRYTKFCRFDNAYTMTAPPCNLISYTQSLRRGAPSSADFVITLQRYAEFHRVIQSSAYTHIVTHCYTVACSTLQRYAE